MSRIKEKTVKIKVDGTEYEKETNFDAVLRNLAIIGGCVDQYNGWSNEFSRKEIREAMQKITEVLVKLDLPSLSTQELIDLGFRWWDNNGRGNVALLLIPIYALPAIPKGTVLNSIDGTRATVGKDEIDNDVRKGMTSSGFMREREE